MKHADLDPEDAAELTIRSFLKPREKDTLVLQSYDENEIPW